MKNIYSNSDVSIDVVFRQEDKDCHQVKMWPPVQQLVIKSIVLNFAFVLTISHQLDFFASREILKQLNHSTIALVSKSANANSAADYRPISCCNITYKVISKILAGRLAHVLNDIISPSQSVFLGGRLMADNINLMQELLRSYGRKRVSPRCTIKIDFRKAFDSIQWSFLRDLLHLLGFPARFVHLVMKCVETASFSIRINGNLFDFFQGKCGVRQGDPLSPYLFIICMEYFSRLLKSNT
jgi:hypothetical protein